MSHARRAAIETVDVHVDSDAPRRDRTSGVGSMLRRAMAPTAIVGLLVATTVLTFVPMGPHETTSVADPLAAYEVRTANRASREFSRVILPTPYAAVTTPVASPSPSVAAVAPTVVATPSAVASVTPAATPAATSAPATTPVAAAAAAAPAKETPAVDWSALGDEAGTRWVTGSVNVRSGPGTEHDVVNAFAEGRKVTITTSANDGWQQVSLKNGSGWIKASFLTEKEPVEVIPSASEESSSKEKSSKGTSSEEKSSGSVGSAGKCAKAGSAENGMQSRTVSVLRKVCAQFSSISSYGGYRAGSSGYHGSGRAIDAMVSGDAGWEVARWVRANASSLGVVEVIYAQKIWTTQRSGDGWRSMSDRGGATANHYDHVHISVR